LPEKSEAWKAEQQQISDEANRKRAEAAQSRPRTETGVFIKPIPEEKPSPIQKQPVVAQSVPVLETKEEHKTRAAKAAASKTNRGTVERMDALVKSRPDLAEAEQKRTRDKPEPHPGSDEFASWAAV
jgi:hypothetical protein